MDEQAIKHELLEQLRELKKDAWDLILKCDMHSTESRHPERVRDHLLTAYTKVYEAREEIKNAIAILEQRMTKADDT